MVHSYNVDHDKIKSNYVNLLLKENKYIYNEKEMKQIKEPNCKLLRQSKNSKKKKKSLHIRLFITNRLIKTFK